MTPAGQGSFAKQYLSALQEYLSGAGEFALTTAYRLGRLAVTEGLSLLELAELHHTALAMASSGEKVAASDVLTRSRQFFTECLSPFEMSLRAYRANARLLGLSESLTRENAELCRARSQLKAILDATLAVIYLKDADSKFLFVNTQFERVFGASQAQILGRCAHECLSAANATTLQRDDARVLGDRRPLEIEETYLHSDGPHTYLALKFPLVDAAGSSHAVCTVATDITQRQRDAEALRAAKEAAEAANRELESFSYSVAHDLRAPLRSIDGFSQALLDECGLLLDATGQHYLANVRQSAQHMGALIDGLLSLAKLSREELRRGEVDLTALARGAAARLQEAEPGRHVTFEIQQGLRALGDARLLAAVMQNLLGNAWKFTRGRENVRIEVARTPTVRGDAFLVRDNGAGFDMAHSNKLFAVFQTLHSRREFEGTGVGLATVQRIVTRHGGHIWAEGALNQGATFYFTLGE